MEQTMEQEIVKQFVDLLEKSGFESITPIVPTGDHDSSDIIDSTLINLKTLNARYDKNEAIHQIKCLMEKYNIQLDQLVDGGRGTV
jgi:hypothetical protein